jgi:hypothetical protein
VLRAGFAGRKELSPDEETRLETALGDVLTTLGRKLAVAAPGVPVGTGQEPRIAKFYQRTCPLLQLITGLCEGADAVAARALETVQVDPDPGPGISAQAKCLETELAAVVPFDVETYRRSRPAAFLPEFDRQLGRCAWVLALDGIYEKPDPDTPRAKNRRARGYRAQSAFLLRHSDLLIAAANPDDQGKAGGTLETVRDALAFELPVVFIHTGTGEVYLVEPEDDLHSVLADRPPDITAREKTLDRWVAHLIADPDTDIHVGHGEPESRKGLLGIPWRLLLALLKRICGDHDQEDARQRGERLLQDYFDNNSIPPRMPDGKRRKTVRERVWLGTEWLFRGGPKLSSDTPLAPYRVYRDRASDLSRHYSGLYRGAFLLNYALAIVAVALAAVSLTLLGTAGHTAVGEQIAELLEAGGKTAEEVAVSPTPRSWLLPALLALAVGKLGILAFIWYNTRLANRERWNDRAVDFRYLAERLRGMFYLPLAGSLEPPAAAPPQFASRVVRQSTIDWLFDAAVRSISPADLQAARPQEISTGDGRGTVTVRKLLTLVPKQTIQSVRDGWIKKQGDYHERNHLTMHAMDRGLEQLSKCLGVLVIVVVAVDLLLVGAKVGHWLPHDWVPAAKQATPWLIFVSAVLPAVVAALGGVRFQSECQRLAERSAVMRVMLRGRGKVTEEPRAGRWALADALSRRIATAAGDPNTDVGSWSHDVLRLTERVATDFVQEAAEWSVLYAKEVSEPG